MCVFLLSLAAFFFQQTFLKVVNSRQDEMPTRCRLAVSGTPPAAYQSEPVFSLTRLCLKVSDPLFGIFISLENSLKESVSCCPLPPTLKLK